MPTRMRPKRMAELVGGSLHWIVKHRIVARQEILRFDDRSDGRIDIVCSAELVAGPAQAQARPPGLALSRGRRRARRRRRRQRHGRAAAAAVRASWRGWGWSSCCSRSRLADPLALTRAGRAAVERRSWRCRWRRLGAVGDAWRGRWRAFGAHVASLAVSAEASNSAGAANVAVELLGARRRRASSPIPGPDMRKLVDVGGGDARRARALDDRSNSAPHLVDGEAARRR